MSTQRNRMRKRFLQINRELTQNSLRSAISEGLLVVENEIGLLRLAARDQLAANDNSAFGELNLLTNLQHLVPSRPRDGGQNEFRADVALREASFIHRAASIGTVANRLHRVRTCKPKCESGSQIAGGESPRCRRLQTLKVVPLILVDPHPRRSNDADHRLPARVDVLHGRSTACGRSASTSFAPSGARRSGRPRRRPFLRRA